MEYLEFLKSKIEIAKDSGFALDPEKINKALKPHQRDAVLWALKGGRRALFESFGLGKTAQELEFCHQAAEHMKGRALIVLPLGVKQEFTRDAVKLLGYEKPEYCRTMAEVMEAKSQIIVTNYEIRVVKREGVDGALVIRDVKTIVKALYPHVVELRLPGCITRSPTYWELAKMRVGGGSSGSQDNQGAPGQLPKNKKGDPHS